MDTGHASETQRNPFNVPQFYAAVLVFRLLCFKEIWDVFVDMKECFKNKTAQLTDNQQGQVLQRVIFTEWCSE